MTNNTMAQNPRPVKQNGVTSPAISVPSHSYASMDKLNIAIASLALLYGVAEYELRSILMTRAKQRHITIEMLMFEIENSGGV